MCVCVTLVLRVENVTLVLRVCIYIYIYMCVFLCVCVFFLCVCVRMFVCVCVWLFVCILFVQLVWTSSLGRCFSVFWKVCGTFGYCQAVELFLFVFYLPSFTPCFLSNQSPERALSGVNIVRNISQIVRVTVVKSLLPRL